MRARDVGVSAVAVAAAYLALQGTPDVGIQLRWILGARTWDRGPALPPTPLPIVTDLDGDGKNEVVVLADGGMAVRVLSIPLASGETLVDPVIVHEVKLAPRSHVPGERRGVALATGYLDPPPTYSEASRRKQHIVVVREDWSVICYDHELTFLWKTPLEHEGSPAEGGSFVIDQVAIAVTHSVRKLKDVGHPHEGLIVVGANMRHQDGHFHSRAAAHDPVGVLSGGADPLGVHVEAFVEGEEDSRDEAEEESMSEDEKRRRAAEHFSLFGLDGVSGIKRWKHIASADRGEIAPPEARAVRRPQYKLQELEELGNPAALDDSTAASGGRRYRRSLLRLLPHAWSSPADTRLEVTALRRRGPSGDASGAGRVGGGDSASVEGGGKDWPGGPGGPGGRRPTSAGRDSVGQGGGQGDVASGGLVRVVVARTREGLEAVELSTGKPLSSVALPAAVGGSGSTGGGGVYADLNGDGLVDHVQAVGTRGGKGWGHVHSGLAMGHLSEQQASPSEVHQQAQQLPPCYALAISGLPPREQLFNGSLCHDAGALLEIRDRLTKPSSRSRARSLDIEVGVSPPAVLWRRPPTEGAVTSANSKAGTGGSEHRPRSDVIFAVSSGVVTSYDYEGRLNWQDRRGPTWAREGPDGHDISGFVVPFKLDAAAGGPEGETSASSPLEEERLLVVGQDKMCVYDRGGRLVGSTPIVAGPSLPPVIGDFDGDGTADVVIVGWGGGAVGYALAPDPGVRVLFVAVLVLVGAMLVVATLHVPPPSSSATSWRKGGGQSRPGAKSKRATD